VDVSIPYGSKYIIFKVPEHRSVDVIAPNEVTSLTDPISLIKHSLEEPIGTKRLESELDRPYDC